jgi:hypothetical protein
MSRMRLPRRSLLSLGLFAAGAGIATVAVAGAQQGTKAAAAAAKPSACVVQSLHPTIKVVCFRGPSGPVGAKGPKGHTGPPGPNGATGAQGTPSQDINIPPTTVALTNGFFTDGGNVQNLATVGPIHIDALCRQTSGNVTATSGVGVGGGHGSGGGASGPGPGHPPRYPAPWLTSGGETEAQVLVWTETGSLSFKGGVGPRFNIPPGPPNYNGPEPNNHVAGSDPVAGVGDHLFVAASNEETDETRGTDPQVDNYALLNGATMLNRYPAFNSSLGGPTSSGIITTSDGHIVIAELLAGFDTLGVHNACVFSGVVEPLA